MHETTFYILLNLKTVNGFESFGRFNLGNNKKAAHGVFQMLKGNKEVDEKNILHLDLMESRDGLPVNMEMLTCTLEELAENCRIITREMFIQFNLLK